MTIDFHFQSANIVKYRTDVTFGWLDLMVSFGGIAGLFLGCSILSGVEIVYFLLIFVITIVKKFASKFGQYVHSLSSRTTSDAERNEQTFREHVRSVRVIKVKSLKEIENNISKSLKNSKKKRY
jgi:Amiloride-sensitive sodium channel